MNEVVVILSELLRDIPTITANRMSIINGKVDFTQCSDELCENAQSLSGQFVSDIPNDKEDIANCIIKIILAEIYYQKDDCYNALIMVNSALAFLEKEGHEEIWVVARYIQMCIMIVTGQLHAIYPLVEGMRERVYSSHNEQLIDNYEALCAWCALYDDDWDTIDKWMKHKAPNEYEHITLSETFSLFTKARIYYMQGQHLAVISLMQVMEDLLKDNNRFMELCELYLIMSMSLAADNHMEEAYDCFAKCLDIAQDRKFLRLLVDEGEAIYRIARLYTRKRDLDDKDNRFIQDIKKRSREMALMYPRYLRNHKEDFPKLTEREIDILKLLVDGRSNAEIADFFGSSVNTIKYHLKNIFRKLGVKNREQAIQAAVEERLIK